MDLDNVKKKRKTRSSRADENAAKCERDEDEKNKEGIMALDIFALIIGFGIGFFVGILLKWILRFTNYVKREGAGLNMPPVVMEKP